MTEGFVSNGQNQIQNNKKNNKHGKKITPTTFTTNPVTLETVLRSEFYPTTKQNPFGNVLLTDIMDDPDRKAAAPSFNPDVHEDITTAVKKQTQMLNPDIISTNKQLYGDLKDNYDLDNAMMRFYSTANTRVTNDQNAFGTFLYGAMYSAKEDTPEGAMMRVKDNYRYTLYFFITFIIINPNFIIIKLIFLLKYLLYTEDIYKLSKKNSGCFVSILYERHLETQKHLN
jgi:hypothetical protein